VAPDHPDPDALDPAVEAALDAALAREAPYAVPLGLVARVVDAVRAEPAATRPAPGWRAAAAAIALALGAGWALEEGLLGDGLAWRPGPASGVETLDAATAPVERAVSEGLVGVADLRGSVAGLVPARSEIPVGDGALLAGGAGLILAAGVVARARGGVR
jgi:hypothetical protein